MQLPCVSRTCIYVAFGTQVDVVYCFGDVIKMSLVQSWSPGQYSLKQLFIQFIGRDFNLYSVCMSIWIINTDLLGHSCVSVCSQHIRTCSFLAIFTDDDVVSDVYRTYECMQ